MPSGTIESQHGNIGSHVGRASYAKRDYLARALDDGPFAFFKRKNTISST